MGGSRCTICDHPERKAIDLALGTEPQRAVARRFGVSRASVQRHLATHQRPALRRELAKRESAGPRALLNRLERWVDVAQRGIDEADKRGDLRSLPNLLREGAGLVKLLGQAGGLWAEKNTTTVIDARVQNATFSALSVDELRSLAALGSGKPENADAFDSEYVETSVPEALEAHE